MIRSLLGGLQIRLGPGDIPVEVLIGNGGEQLALCDDEANDGVRGDADR